MGGLGNMLFQVAFAESLSKKFDCDVVYTGLKDNFDYIKSHYNRSPYADDYLKVFPNVDWTKNQDRLKEIKHRINVPFHYIEIEPKDGTEYVGYFQSEKYFYSLDFIRELFDLDEDIKYNAMRRYADLFSGNTCSIHVRRADYLIMPDFHPTLGIDYYQTSVNMLDHFDIDRFLVFSDDMPWCRENFQIPNVEFISNKDYLDFYIMTLCDYSIIANSSFSLLAALLSNSKTVIVPRKWLGSRCSDDYKDVIPDRWFKV